MDITQLLIHLAVIVGMALMVALAVVPLWLEGEARKADAARARTIPAAPVTRGTQTRRTRPAAARGVVRAA